MISLSLVPHVRMVFSIGTGFGLSKIQENINQILSRAINKIWGVICNKLK